jgi:hypothetical protein
MDPSSREAAQKLEFKVLLVKCFNKSVHCTLRGSVPAINDSMFGEDTAEISTELSGIAKRRRVRLRL